MTPLDEKALRRPDWADGYKVALGDGQEWSFPRAKFRVYPKRNPDGSIAVVEGLPFGLDYGLELDRLLDLDDETVEAANERITLQVSLAAKLLLRNYDLDDAALATLLPLEYDGSNGEMWGEIGRAMMGFSPKA